MLQGLIVFLLGVGLVLVLISTWWTQILGWTFLVAGIILLIGFAWAERKQAEHND